MLTKDQLIKEYENRRGSWQAIVGIYVALIGLFVFSAAII